MIQKYPFPWLCVPQKGRLKGRVTRTPTSLILMSTSYPFDNVFEIVKNVASYCFDVSIQIVQDNIPVLIYYGALSNYFTFQTRKRYGKDILSFLLHISKQVLKKSLT